MAHIRFSTVTERAESIAIVGTGKSFLDVDLSFPSRIKVIAVNHAINFLPEVDFWFTLDPSLSVRHLMRNPRLGVTYYAAVPSNYGTLQAECLSMRMVADRHVKYLRRVEGMGHGRYRTKSGMASKRNEIYTGNSVFGALQLAKHMEAKYIGLFGVDGEGKYFYGGYPLNLTMMPELLASTVPILESNGIQVINGSKNSVVTCFPRMKAVEVRAWLIDQ